MKSVFFIFLLAICSGIEAQSRLVIQSPEVPFRLAVDGLAAADSAATMFNVTLQEPGTHLLDIVFEDQSQSVISRSIRSEDHTEVHYIASCGEYCAFIPLFLIRPQPNDSLGDTLTYVGKYLHNGRPTVCHFPMSEDDFLVLMSNVREKEFDFQKEAAIRNSMKTLCFSTGQLQSLLSLIEFEDKRLEMTSGILDYCTDLESAHKLASLFVFEKSKKQFLESLR